MHVLKKPAALVALTLSSTLFAQPLGIIGGVDNTGSMPAYAALISSSGSVLPINTGLSSGHIDSVAINALGQGIIGGQDTSGSQPAYAAFVSPSGSVSPINTGLTNGEIFSVAINAHGQGIIGGENFITPFPYAAFVSPSGMATSITGLPTKGGIFTVAINDSNQGLIGGKNFSAAYAAYVSPSGIATPLTLDVPDGFIDSATINNVGEGIIGGEEIPFVLGPAYAARVSPSGLVTPIDTGVINGFILSVAINASNQGIIGGQAFFTPTTIYAAFVSPSGIATPINTGLSSGRINGVAINASGQGIIGGQDASGFQPAYAAFVFPNGVTTLINTGLSNGIINSVAINDFGQAIIGGQDLSGSQPAYAAIVSPNGVPTPLNLGLSNGIINAVAILPLLTHIPTETLNGNNLIFANYINNHAPQDAFYFAPAFFDGTLAQALESAAPTRNAISLYTASSNLFYLTTSLSNHLRNRYVQKKRGSSASHLASSKSEFWKSEDEFLASMYFPKKKRASEIPNRNAETPNEVPETAQIPNEVREIQPLEEEYKKKHVFRKVDEKTNSIWIEAIGASAYQKAQHQTPGFHPSSGGAILAFDGKTSEHTRMGVGAAYLFTHINEKHRAGHSNINQEDLFIYGSWENKKFYVDAALLGGLFQIHQVRQIHMTGFDFKSKSHPHGWQLLPHMEFGYHTTPQYSVHLTLNPFVMVDWANAWQHRYKETGTGPFNTEQKSHYSSLLRTEISLRLYETLFFETWDLILQEKAGYVNVHSFRTGKVTAFLVGSPGSFTVSTLTGGQNLGVGEFAMIFAPHHSGYPITTIFYQGEFGTQYQSHQVALELSWDF